MHLWNACLQNNFLHQLVEKPTRFRHEQNPSLLDLIITNDDALISEVSESTPLGKSDHAILHFKMSCYKDFPQEEFVEKFNMFKYDKGDYKAIQDDLSKINWDDELDTQTVDDAWNVFINHFTATMDKI